MELSTYLKLVRILAAVSIFTTGLLQAIYYPGLLNVFNGAATGLVIYSLWRAE